MIENNAIPFDKEANERWNKIPKLIQVQILDNVWCSGCSAVSNISLESAKMQQRDLILRGKCKACGQEVCRVVEPETH